MAGCNEHWGFLQAQLRQCMSKQVEVLIRGKRQTEGTLHSLRRQVDALDELVSSTSSESLFLAQSSSLVSLHSAQSATGTQVMLCWVGVLHPFWLTVRAPSGSAGDGDPTLPLVSLAVAALFEKGCFPQRVVFSLVFHSSISRFFFSF